MNRVNENKRRIDQIKKRAEGASQNNTRFLDDTINQSFN